MITSIQNSRIKDIIKLRDKPHERREKGTFITEGVRMFCEAPDDKITEIYISESMQNRLETSASGDTYEEKCRKKLERHEYETVTDEVMKHMSDTQTPQGILCVVKQDRYAVEDMIGNGKTPLIVMLEDIQDPGNLGTVFRTSEGAGVTGIIMSRNTADIYNPKTIRSTMGSIYRVPFMYTEDLCDAADTLKSRQIKVYAAYLAGSASYEKCDYRTASAFMIGNEGNGLTREAAEKADVCIRIPMEGKLESLNAAVSASILVYEAHRQRN